MIRTVLRIALLTLAFAIATMLFGWWGLLFTGLAWGFLARSTRAVGFSAAVAAALAWAGLLLGASVKSPVGALASTVSAVLGAPSIALAVLTLVFGTALGWSAARCAAGLAEEVAGRRR